ncbi:MAG: glycosyltransferase family 2 protein [Faecalibacillus sp.]
MKLLTVCIPCCNSIETMHKTISSCLLMKDEIEVLIIDNLSTDETLEVAKEYEKEYPDTIKVVENHCEYFSLSLVLKNCQGLYFKLLQCGDYLDQPSLVSVIETLRDFIRIQANLDLLITDYKYVSLDKKDQKITYKNMFPTETLFKWHSMKIFQKHNQVDIASLIVKTNILFNLDDNIKNTSYNSQKIVYGTIPYIKSMYYLQTYFYCYGKKEKKLLNNVDHYIVDLKEMWTMYNVFSLKSRKQRNYVIEMLSRMYVTTQYLIIKNNQCDKGDALDLYLKEWDDKLYKAVTRHLSGVLLHVSHNKAQAVIIKLFEKIYKYD